MTDRALEVRKRSHKRQMTRQEPWPQSGQDLPRVQPGPCCNLTATQGVQIPLARLLLFPFYRRAKMRLREVKGRAQGTKVSRWLSQGSHPDGAGPRPAPASETQQPSSQHVPLRVCRPALGLPTVARPFPFWDPHRHSLIMRPAGLCLEQLLRKARATLGSSYSPTRRAVPGGKTEVPADLRVDLSSPCRRVGTSERLLRDKDARLICPSWGSILSALKLAGGKGHSQARARGNSEASARGPRQPTWALPVPGRLAMRAVPPDSREAASLSCSRRLRGRAPGKLCKRTRNFVTQDGQPPSRLLGRSSRLLGR